MRHPRQEIDELREQVRLLTMRVWEMEQRLAQGAPRAPPGSAAAPPPSAAGFAPPPEASPQPAPFSWPTPAAAPAAPARDLETTLGVRWLTALGTLVLVLGGAWFVIYFLGEALQILTGVAGGLALAALGEALHRRGKYGPYPYFLLAGGVVLVYFSVFAAYFFEDYRAATGMTLLADAFVLGVVALGGVALALRYDSRAIASEGFALGFLTALLARSDEAATSTGVQALALAYVAILAAGLLAVVALRRWTDVGVGGAAATWIVLAILRPDLGVSPWAYAGIVLLVAGELWLLSLRSARLDVTLAGAVATLASAGGGALLWWNADLAWPTAAPHVLWVLAAVHAAAAFALREARLRGVAGLLAAAFAFLWAPAAYDGWAVTVVWSALAVALAAVAARFANATPWIRVAAYGGAALVAFRALGSDAWGYVATDPAAWPATLAVAAATASLLAAYLLLGAAGARLPTDERELAARLLLGATVLAPLPWLYFRLENWASVGWAAEGAALVAAGFLATRRDVRLAGIAVLLLVVARVLLVDSSALDIGWRVVVFLAVGALVLGAAFLFARQKGATAGR